MSNSSTYGECNLCLCTYLKRCTNDKNDLDEMTELARRQMKI